METINNGSTALYNEAILQQLYSSNSGYLSEIDFFEEEMEFLKTLLEENFMVNIKDEHVNRIQLLYVQLKQTERLKNMIKEDMIQHKQNLEGQFSQQVNRSMAFLNMEHEKVEEEIKSLVNKFKDLKIEILNISRKALVN